MTKSGTDTYCPLCGATLEEDEYKSKACPECSFKFTEDDDFLIFDFRDLNIRESYAKDILEKIKKVEDKAFSRTSDIISEFLDEEYELRCGEIKEFDLSQPPSYLSREGIVFASFSRIKGRISGTLLMLITPDNVRQILSKSFQGMVSENGMINDIGESLVTELGTILTSEICDNFAQQFKTKVDMTPPVIVLDMSSAIMNYIISEFSQIEEIIDYYEVNLESISGISIKVHFFPHPSTKKIFLDSIV